MPESADITLATPPAYNFNLFYQIHARYPHPSLFALRDGAYLRAFGAGSDMSLAEVRSDGDKLLVRVLAGNSLPPERIQRILATDTDLTAFYDFAETRTDLWKVVHPIAGLPLYRSETLYEALIFVIIEQHISWVNAQRAQRTLVEWGGNSINYCGQTYFTIPPPEQLAGATVEQLKPLKITYKRMQLLIHIARMFVDDPSWMTQNAQVIEQTKVLYNRLLKIRGIGHWTASVVVSRATGNYPFVPHNDVALQSAVAAYFDAEKSSYVTQAIFERFGEYAGLAAHFTLMRWVLDRYPVVSG